MPSRSEVSPHAASETDPDAPPPMQQHGEDLNYELLDWGWVPMTAPRAGVANTTGWDAFPALLVRGYRPLVADPDARTHQGETRQAKEDARKQMELARARWAQKKNPRTHEAAIDARRTWRRAGAMAWLPREAPWVTASDAWRREGDYICLTAGAWFPFAQEAEAIETCHALTRTTRTGARRAQPPPGGGADAAGAA